MNGCAATADLNRYLDRVEAKQYAQLGDAMAQWNREYHESCAEDVATYNVMRYGSDDDEAA